VNAFFESLGYVLRAIVGMVKPLSSKGRKRQIDARIDEQIKTKPSRNREDIYE